MNFDFMENGDVWINDSISGPQKYLSLSFTNFDSTLNTKHLSMMSYKRLQHLLLILDIYGNMPVYITGNGYSEPVVTTITGDCNVARNPITR